MHTICALLFALPFAVSAQGDVRKDLDRLKGTWVLVTAEGKPAPVGAHAALVVSGDKYQGLENGKLNESGTIKLDSSTKPMSIDLLIDTGTSAGKTQLGLVDVIGDTLTLTLGEPGAARPAASAMANTLVLTRLKPIAKEFEGSWVGEIPASARVLRLVFTLTNGADGLATGTLTSVDQGNTEAPIAAVVQTGSTLMLIIPSIRGAYEGELKDGQITGTWMRGAGRLPMVLKRMN